MIEKWASGFPAACYSACIFSGIYRFSFSAYIDSIISLNDLVRTANLALPVTLVALDSVVVLVLDVALT